MIYAKTGMGRMPSNCNQCTFFCAVDDPLKPFGCVIKRKPVNARNGRPSWCPLSAETKEQKIKDMKSIVDDYREHPEDFE